MEDYPKHIYDLDRQEIVISYVKHELRKLFWRVPRDCWKKIDSDVSDWIKSPSEASINAPRDFWNLFHGICMGYKLKIGLIYFVTAENVAWEKTRVSISDLWFGTDLDQTRVVGEGKLSAEQVMAFYNDPKNKKIKVDKMAFTMEKSSGTAPRDYHPIIVTQKKRDTRMIYSTYDGNRRLVKAILEGKEEIEAFVGSLTSGEQPKNYWIPTTILMENLLFARWAHERDDKKLFNKYMAVLRDMLSFSESAKYELKERALTGGQPFRGEVLKILEL